MKINLISHGTIGLYLLKPNQHLNLTSVEKIDKLFNELDYYSFNQSNNQFTFSASYCLSNKNTGWFKYEKPKSIKRRYPKRNELNHPSLYSVIKVWVVDKRFKDLEKQGKLVSRNISKHHYIKNKFKTFKEKEGIYFDMKELLIKDKRLVPIEDIIIFGYNIFNDFQDFEHIRDYYNISDKTSIIIDGKSLLEVAEPEESKYKLSKPKSIDIRLTKACMKVLQDDIQNYIIEAK